MSKRGKKTARSPTATRTKTTTTARPPTATRSKTTTTARPPTATASSSTATITETTLFCLVHGEPPSSYFKIKVGNNDDTDDLRKLIKKESGPYFDAFAPWQLKLWIVDIPFSSQNLGDSSINIANVLQGREFLPPNKVGDIFTTVPNENNIHIIVELPTSSAPAAQTSSNLSQDVTDEIHEIYRRITQQTIETCIISRIDTEKFANLTNYLNLKIEEVSFSGLHGGRSPSAFEWGETPESAQNNEYMRWLRRNIPLPGAYVWHDVKGNQHLLDLLRDPRLPMLPFNVSGGTDVVVVNNYNVESDMIRESIYAVLELKKSIDRKDIRQVILQMIVADLITPKSRNVFGILSDLGNDWRIYWFGNDRTIKCWKAPGPGVAVQVIQDLFADSETDRSDTSTVLPAVKRVKLDTLLSDRNTMFDDDVARLEDVYDVMSKEEIIHHKIGVASEIIRTIPSFLSMYS